MTSADTLELVCPCCRSNAIDIFYEVENVPVNSVLLLPTKEDALSFPTGNIALGFCRECGFIYNAAFDPTLLEYSARYESSQAHSETFDRWQKALAKRLIERYQLQHKQLLEIGCGNGEFLTLLCELGDNTGVGFDPAYVSDQATSASDVPVTVIADLYSEKYSEYGCDFICCKMTLEHISNPHEFVSMIRRSIGARQDVVVFFQVPDVLRILDQTAFWDVYYEHCAYFSLGSLARLFNRCGFKVIGLSRGFDDQYIMIDAVPDSNSWRSAAPQPADLSQLADLTKGFAAGCAAFRHRWRERLRGYQRANHKVVVWGSSSKGVAFLTVLAARDEVEYVVDINPRRQEFFMAGTGQRIVSQEFLRDYRPDVVIVMNPIYREEIADELKSLELVPELVTI